MASILRLSTIYRSRYSVQATGCTVRGSNRGRDKGLYSCPKRPDPFWGPLSSLVSGYQGSFSGGGGVFGA